MLPIFGLLLWKNIGRQGLLKIAKSGHAVWNQMNVKWAGLPATDHPRVRFRRKNVVETNSFWQFWQDPKNCSLGVWKELENGRFLGGFERYLHVTYTTIFQITFYYKDFSFTDPQSMFKSHFKQVWWKVNKPPFGCSTSPSNNVDTIKSLLSTVVPGRERTLTVGGSIAVRLVSSLTGL